MAQYDERLRVNVAAHQCDPVTWGDQHARIPSQRERHRHAAQRFAAHFSGLSCSVRWGRPNPPHGWAIETALIPGLRLLADGLDHFSPSSGMG